MAGNQLTLPDRLKRFEKRMILKALMMADFVHSEAAKLLGINRTNLVQKMKRHGFVLKTHLPGYRGTWHQCNRYKTTKVGLICIYCAKVKNDS